MIQLLARVEAAKLPLFYIQSDRLVRRLTERLHDLVLKRTPVRTGRLAESLRMEFRGGVGVVGFTAPYARYVELGTRPHLILPRRARALRFEVGKWWQPRRVVYAARVHHPGTRPQYFVRDAIEALHREFPQVCMDWMREVFR